MICPNNTNSRIQNNCRHTELAFMPSWWYNTVDGVTIYTCRCSVAGCNCVCRCENEDNNGETILKALDMGKDKK